MAAYNDISGMVFGHWRVIEYAGSELWKCVCGSCSRIYYRKSNFLKRQKYGQCRDCYGRKTHVTHGHTVGDGQSKSYSAWCGMIQRCTNPNGQFYNRYGGRGIRVCKAWQKFENFLRDMGEPPPKLTLGRIDNDGNYEPSNCRLETRLEQVNNRGVCRFVTYEGRRMTVSEFARLVDTWPCNIYKALDRAKCPHGEAPRIVQVPWGTLKRFALC